MSFNRATENLIANLRGLPEDRGSSRLRPTASIADILETLAELRLSGAFRPQEVILEHWSSIVSPKVASHCGPQKIIKGSSLVILADNSVVKQNLLFERKSILQNLQKLPACKGIHHIIIRGG